MPRPQGCGYCQLLTPEWEKVAENLKVLTPTLEATQVKIDGFFSQLPYKCHQHLVASVGD